MAQLSDNCFAFGGELLRTKDALSQLDQRLHAVTGTETIALKGAVGRTLASNIISPMAVPPHDNAAVDGYALRYSDLSTDTETKLKLIGRIAAGDACSRAIRAGETVRIFTGAAIPKGADTVLMQEDCQETEGTVTIPPGIKKGANFRFSGEDIAAGARILEAGTVLRPQEIGLLASTGQTMVPVYKKLRVALFSTGNEVRDIGQDLPAGHIYDANRYSIGAALDGLGCLSDDLGILPDSHDGIRERLLEISKTHDLIMTSGGVSTGEEDHIRSAVANIGQIHFWRLAIRPGRPIALGQVGQVPFVGLPGNPVAVLVTFMIFARPAILKLGGCRKIAPVYYKVQSGFSLRKKLGRREWLRVSIKTVKDGFPVAHKFPRDGAGILTSMVEAEGLVELPEDLTELRPGSMVEYLPFNEVG
ncbi:MAG: gephyrin-like molybdotransferase Glp [Pseudomonadota bacterium]|nr:gephyrin-like molybdotransferase Glp [Pseudomonadota bacterium]